MQRLQQWTKNDLMPFVLSQLTHTVINVMILGALFFGGARVGALDRMLAPLAPTSGTSFTTLNYQGRLADPGGIPISDTLTFNFSLYDAPTEGNLLWGPESHDDVPVSDGLFSVRLGKDKALSTNLFNSGDLWLEIVVKGETLSPREKLTAVPYAMVAGEALTVADGSVTSRKLARTVHEVAATQDIPMPSHHQGYEVLSYSLYLEHETLVTIYSSIAPQNNEADAFFYSKVFVDGAEVAHGESWNRAAFGETITTQSVIVLEPGQHDIVVRASSWSDGGFVCSDVRTKLVIVEG